MALPTRTIVYLDGVQLNRFTSYQLVQDIGRHHVFTLRCGRDTFDRSNGSLFDNAHDLLGKPLYFETSLERLKDPATTLSFSGIITGLENERGAVDSQRLLITAHSSTIALEGGHHYASYASRPLDSIVKEVLGDTDPALLPAYLAPVYAGDVPYSVQHQNNWAYLCRLAAQYGEWLYYDGTQLVFGKPPESDELLLKQGHGLVNYAVSIHPTPHRETFFAVDYERGETLRTPGYDKLPQPNGRLSSAITAGEIIYPSRPRTWVRRGRHEAQEHELELQAMATTAANAQRSVRLRASSSNPGVGLGGLVAIETEGADEGTFRVTRVVHSGEYMGNYQNDFEGISVQLDAYPLTDVHAYPRSESQVAVVQETDDPDGMGRVRVQFT